MDLLDERYELREVIGRGGTAEVHRAWDRVLQREVAVKLLLAPGALEEAETARLRFASESRLLARLDHPGLVTLLDVGTSAGRPYFVLELVDGGTVAGLLAAAPLEPAVVADLGAQLADALAHAHAQDIVHRDVKPGNVLLAPGGRVKLADFGIARLIGEGVGVTRTGHTVGTIAYLAPEQVRGERVGPPVDVYALGLLLLEALTGVRAYPGTSTESAFARLHHGPTIPLSLPTGWPRLLAAMTAADPADRPTAAVAAAALRDLAAGRPVVTPLADMPRTVTSASAGPRTRSVRLWPARRRTARWVGVAAAVVVGAVAGIGTLGPDPAVSEDAPAVSAASRIQPASVLSRAGSSGAHHRGASPSASASPAAERTQTPRQPRATAGDRRRSPAADRGGRDHGPQGKARGHTKGKGHPGGGSKGKGGGKKGGGKKGGKPGKGKGR